MANPYTAEGWLARVAAENGRVAMAVSCCQVHAGEPDNPCLPRATSIAEVQAEYERAHGVVIPWRLRPTRTADILAAEVPA